MPIEITGLDAIVKKLEALDDPGVFRAPMQLSVNHLQLKLKDKPMKAPGAFSRLATPGQRRAYWAKVSSGEISHGSGGYNRTGNTARAWTTDVSPDGRTGKVGNLKPGARWVYGEQTQQPFHTVSGWPRVDKVAKQAEHKILGYFKAALDRAVNK